jgi:hypothetical protein
VGVHQHCPSDATAGSVQHSSSGVRFLTRSGPACDAGGGFLGQSVAITNDRASTILDMALELATSLGRASGSHAQASGGPNAS